VNEEVDDVIPHDTLAMDHVIQRKGEVSHRPHYEDRVRGYPFGAKKSVDVPDKGFLFDIERVIPLEWHMKGV
jgi:hypothetical protein